MKTSPTTTMHLITPRQQSSIGNLRHSSAQNPVKHQYQGSANFLARGPHESRLQAQSSGPAGRIQYFQQFNTKKIEKSWFLLNRFVDRFLARGPHQSRLQAQSSGPAGRRYANLARGPSFLLCVCTLVRPAGHLIRNSIEKCLSTQ